MRGMMACITALAGDKIKIPSFCIDCDNDQYLKIFCFVAK